MDDNISACKLSRRCLADYYAKKLHKKRAARLFFIIQPIKSLGLGGGVALLKDGEVYRSG